MEKEVLELMLQWCYATKNFVEEMKAVHENTSQQSSNKN